MASITDTDIEKCLKEILQRKIRLNIRSKQYKKGKFLLFKQNNYHIEFTIKKDDGELKRFEVPIPFKVEIHDNCKLIYFDYRFSTLAKNNNELLKIIRSLPKEGNSKFYDQILEIEIME